MCILIWNIDGDTNVTSLRRSGEARRFFSSRQGRVRDAVNRQQRGKAAAQRKSPCHACAFFHSQDEEYELLLPFSKSGEAAHDRLFQVVDHAHLAERRRRLAEAGVDVEQAERNGQLELRPWENTYLRESRFDQNAMLTLIQDVLKEGRSRGFGMTRLWADMEWALEDLPGVHDLVEYETRLNKFLPDYDDVVVCTYDLNKFSAPIVMDIMRTHPQVIIGGVLQENPFYVPPEELLDELQRRNH